VPVIEGMAGWRIAGLILVGLAGLMAGAWLLVTGATGIARDLGISETVIGLTVVAVGTSLPELATSVVAARRGEAGLALGNIIGSNVFNIFAILGLTALLIPIPVPPGLTPVDLAFFAGSALILVAFLVIGRIGRGAGLGMLAPMLPISAGSRSGLPDFRAKHRRRADRMPRPLARAWIGVTFSSEQGRPRCPTISS
jgi:hypothetical protein